LSKKTRMMESFGSRVRDEVLSVETFDSVLEAQTVITDRRTIYNHRRPHSSLGWRPPAAYAVRQAALCAAHARQLRDMGLEIVGG
jgi:transposase InsO family protein